MQDIVSGEMRVYEGHYLPHWEVGRLCIDTGRKWLGMFPIRERWILCIPDDIAESWERAIGEPRSIVDYNKMPPKMYYVKVRGIVGNKGSYGHKGWCHRELQVSEVLEVEEVAFRRSNIW